MYYMNEANASQMRLPGCSRNHKDRRGNHTTRKPLTRKPLSTSGFNIRANASDPIIERQFELAQ